LNASFGKLFNLGRVLMSSDNKNIAEMQKDFEEQLSSCKSEQDLETLRREWLGKDGHIKSLMQQLREVPAAEKPQAAAGINALKDIIELALTTKKQEFQAATLALKLSSEWLDPSLPGSELGIGRRHPITAVEQKIMSLLRPFGFRSVYGPEIETEYYCFDALNIPAHHPARDMQDTFYTEDGRVLRTHTTSVQARILEQDKAPIKVASFGRVYRNEAEDASHQAMFHQFELVWLEKGLTLANLMGLITHLLKGLYGQDRKVKFVPKFYPYTEPSIGPQINCLMCAGEGCSLCGHSGWVTIAGAGMIHRKVLTEFGFNPEEVNGFAFGLGTGRLACQAANLSDGRLLYENDLRRF
jgi:phenylalanyl-tRNA synthetase alpha chain